MKQHHSALTRSTQTMSGETKRKELLESSAGVPRRVLWIDGVGGFLLIDRDETVLGQALSSTAVDVAIVGDLSRQAAAILRTEGDYLIQPLQPVQIDGQAVERPQLLRDGQTLQLGNRVKLRFSKSSPLSSTARLDLVSLHQFKPNVNGVLLLADSCILGPRPGSHVLCPNWKSELLLFRHASGWFFRTLDEVDVDGQTARGQIPLVAGMRMRGDDFSLSVE